MEKNNIRIYNIVTGLVEMGLAILVLIFSVEAVIAFLIFLGIGMLIVGFARMIDALTDEKLSNIQLIWRLVVSVAIIILSLITVFLTITNPTLAITILIIWIGIAFLLTGLVRFFEGILMKEYWGWMRGLFIVVGLITIILAFLVILFPILGFIYIIVTFSISLLLNGLVRFLLGIVNIE
ncbi:MAG: DUF308 domain-containing protein [Promethearchaeati archaeon]